MNWLVKLASLLILFKTSLWILLVNSKTSLTYSSLLPTVKRSREMNQWTYGIRFGEIKKILRLLPLSFNSHAQNTNIMLIYLRQSENFDSKWILWPENIHSMALIRFNNVPLVNFALNWVNRKRLKNQKLAKNFTSPRLHHVRRQISLKTFLTILQKKKKIAMIKQIWTKWNA